jgi:hypothetical protein
MKFSRVSFEGYYSFQLNTGRKTGRTIDNVIDIEGLNKQKRHCKIFALIVAKGWNKSIFF